MMDERIEHVKQHIAENLHRPVNRSILAEVACMSVKHFQREFKKQTGITPAIYVENLKVRKSMELIRELHPVSEIAASVGYYNYETYSRVFKKYCHIAPSELQFFVRRIGDLTEPDSPVVMSRTTNPDQLALLVSHALKDGTFTKEQLDKLQVCIILPDFPGRRTRKAVDKYTLDFREDLVPGVLTRIGI